MGKGAAGAVLVALFSIPEMAAAVLAQGVQGAVAEQAVEPVGIINPVAGEVFAFPILEKGVVLCLFIQGVFLL